MKDLKTTSLSCLVATGTMALLVQSTALAGPPIGDDFNTASVANWQQDDPLSGIFGPTTYDVVDGAYRITTVNLPPVADLLGAGAGFVPSAASPDEYVDGTVRARVRFHNDDSNAGIFMRATGSGGVGTGYNIFLNNVEDAIGIADVAAGGGNISATDYPLEAGVDYMVEGRTVGDEISIKIWPHGAPVPADPQVSINNAMYPDGGFLALIVYNQPSNAGGTGGKLDVSFDDIVYTPAAWERLDDFTTGSLANWTTLDFTNGLAPDFSAADGRAVITTKGPASNTDGALLASTDSIVDPVSYSNGRLRATFNVDDTNAVLVARGDVDQFTSYNATYRPTDGMLSIGRIDSIKDDEVLVETPVGYGNDTDLVMEFTFVGDTFSAKAWAADEAEPAEPQLVVTDDTYQVGGVAVGADGPAVIDTPAPFSVEIGDVWFTPEQACLPADLNCDGAVNVSDMLVLLGDWGDCPSGDSCPADLNSDGAVNVSDLLMLLGEWG